MCHQRPRPTQHNFILPILSLSLSLSLSVSASLSKLSPSLTRPQLFIPEWMECIYIYMYIYISSHYSAPRSEKERLIINHIAMNNSPTTTCSRSWSISEDSLRRFVRFASESCVQELLSASDSSRFGNGNGNGNGNDGWKIVNLENGVELSKRRSGSFHAFRSRWLLRSVSPQQFITVANAIDAARWDPDLVEARYIKDLGDNLSIIRLRFGENSKPLFRNREFIVYERRETMEDGTVVVAVASLPKEIAAGLHPKQNNAIRGLLLQSGWVVEKLEVGSCMVTYVVQLDPAGWLPKCFVNRLNTRLAMIIENLKKIAQVCASPTDADAIETVENQRD